MSQHDRVQRRYRERVGQLPLEWPALIDTLLDHRSVRRFLPDALADGTLELLVAAAQSASTSSNKQFWSVVAVEDPARKRRLAHLCAAQSWVADAPLLLVWLADLSRITAIGADQRVSLEAVDYLESFIVAVIDATLAAQNAAVAAEALGLGAVYIGAMRDHPTQVAKELGLPQRCFAVFGMCLGRPDPATMTDVKPRLPQGATLHREQYQPEAWKEAVHRYQSHNNQFRAEQGMDQLNWTEQMMMRLKDPQSLNGREHLRSVLDTMGFGLR